MYSTKLDENIYFSKRGKRIVSAGADSQSMSGGTRQNGTGYKPASAKLVATPCWRPNV
jgi:hypothetical protein